MKWSFASVAVIVAGIIGIVIILLFQQITTNNESDYYLLKEITEAAMAESIDIEVYQTEGGKLQISREKFVENFIRRFSESTTLTGKGYKINFYDIIETPPKVSIIIETDLGEYKIFEDTSDYKVVNRLDAILEYISEDEKLIDSSKTSNPYTNGTKTVTYYSLVSNNDSGIDDIRALAIPEELKAQNIKNVKIKQIEQVQLEDKDLTQEKLDTALLWRNINFVYSSSDIANKLNETNYALSIKDFTYSKDVTLTGINCSDKGIDYVGNDTRTAGVDCQFNSYWVRLTGKGATAVKNKKSVMTEYKVTWSYEEYKYSE